MTSRIITITFSPCIDKSAEVENLVPEKKLKCSNLKSEPGGGGINIARVLNKFGIEALAVFPSGGCNGKIFNTLLEKQNVPSVIIEARHETRENLVIDEQSTGRQFRFSMPASELTEKECRTCLKAVENIKDIDYIIASGSLPATISATVLIRLAALSQKKGAKFIVDTSGPALKNVLKNELFMIKPNLTELAYLSNRKTIPASQAEKAAKKILALSRCEIIVVSLGSKGAVLVTRNQSFRVMPPKVLVKSSVGAGDSMVAGMVYALAKGNSLEKSLCFAVACGTAAAMNKGTALCGKKDAETIFKIIKNNV
jgi:6-phosphofructokinase 2